MENRIKTSLAGLKAQAVHAAAGLAQYGAALNLTYITDEIMNGKVAALETADMNYKRGKTQLAFGKEAVDRCVEEGRAFLFIARDVLKPFLGKFYNSMWDEPGYRHSLKVPTQLERLLQLLLDQKNYFTAHPEHENEKLSVTASRAEHLYDTLKDAIAGLIARKAAVKELLAKRKTREVDITTALRGLIKTLTAVLAPLDPRWLAFGLNMPGLKATPDAPKNVVAIVQAKKVVALKWNPAARANIYRIWKKIGGVDEEFVLVDSRTELDAIIEGLPTGVTIEFAISASNSGGESARSQIVSVLIPA